jgi:hypothetical protein
MNIGGKLLAARSRFAAASWSTAAVKKLSTASHNQVSKFSFSHSAVFKFLRNTFLIIISLFAKYSF